MKTVACRSAVCGLLALPLAYSAGAQTPTPSVAATRDTMRYTVLTASRPSGTQSLWRAPDGARYVEFEFNDRGRGPHIRERITIGADKLPRAIEISGHDYLKNAVQEHFRIDGDRAVWKSSADSGSAPASRAFYVSYDGAPEEGAVLARALLAAPGGRLPLLPGGEARIEKVADRTVRTGGQQRAVSLYAVSGLGFGPTFVWLDADGEYFASGSTWSMVIRRGWEGVAPDLVRAQEASDSARTAKLARSLARRPRTALVFRGATLFDAEGARLVARTTVVVTGNRITAVGPDGRVAVPAGAEVIDAAGKTLAPGLWDMHVHVQDNQGLLHIAAGVTTVRDLANDTDELIARRKKFDLGTLVGPRILMAGFMDGPGPYAGPTKVLVSTPDEVRAAVRKYASLGYPQIKMYSSIKPELVPVIIEEAHRKGMGVSGHVPAFMTAEEVVKLGFDELQHVNFLFLNFWGDSVKDTRTPLRFTAVAQRAAELDLGSARVQQFIGLLKERNVVVDPTVNVFERQFVARKGSVDPGYAAVADLMPPQVRRGFLRGGLPVPEGMDQRYRDSFGALLKMVKALYDAGVTMVAGTDAFAGFALHRELELYAAAGMPPNRVLQIATLGAARVAKRENELGSIAPGKLADLILIDGNPVERMSDIRRTTLVVKDGVVYEPAGIYRAIGVRPLEAARSEP